MNKFKKIIKDYKLFTFFWITITVLVLIFTLYIAWKLSVFILILSCVLYILSIGYLIKRNSLLWRMKKAIKNKKFYPTYQPLFDRDNNHYAGVEILVRWENTGDKDNVIMPDVFIGEAESNGLIVPITLQIIEQAFKDTLHILKNTPHFHLAFNISATHFTDSEFFEQFTKLVDNYAITPNQVILEITEREVLDRTNEVFLNKMRELRKVGFSLAIDDYGTGHASISYLHHFPFNYLKIDKLFIQSIGTKAITEPFNDVIISMAKRLNLIIIAEGVETEEQVNYLASHDVRYLQGWYYSKAISVEQLVNLLEGETHD